MVSGRRALELVYSDLLVRALVRGRVSVSWPPVLGMHACAAHRVSSRPLIALSRGARPFGNSLQARSRHPLASPAPWHRPRCARPCARLRRCARRRGRRPTSWRRS
eukprot:4975025-Prymnesium_polylepis.1